MHVLSQCRSILLIFRIKKFHGDQFWLNYVCCVRVCALFSHFFTCHWIEPRVQIPTNATATAVNLFLSSFFPTFFSIFQFLIHELSERNSMYVKKIDHKFSFCTIFFPRFIQKSQRFSQFHCLMIERTPPRCARKKADPVCQHSQKEWKPIKMRKLNK